MGIRVTDVLDLLAAGLGIDEVLTELPDLERDDVMACLKFASRRVDHPILAACRTSASVNRVASRVRSERGGPRSRCSDEVLSFRHEHALRATRASSSNLDGAALHRPRRSYGDGARRPRGVGGDGTDRTSRAHLAAQPRAIRRSRCRRAGAATSSICLSR
ncbi:MAG: DUF433 domain-containing protein [Deltaproteobacteria bacterium]|nr:DUF433 domain-containing protein [Deltaproteobacteria bacterium]